MLTFNLLTGRFDESIVASGAKKGRSVTKIGDKFTGVPAGCTHCPLGKVKGVRKILGLARLRERHAMLWAQSPGATENERGKELVGDSGRLLWRACDEAGLCREDFDIQNVLRCRPLGDDGKEHPPEPLELYCCSKYNFEALRRNNGKAHVHLILGKVAAETLLGKNYAKDSPIFWHEEWNAYVVLCDHPSYVIRSGGVKSGEIYKTFVRRLHAVAAILKYPGRYGYLRAQRYATLHRPLEVVRLLQRLAQEEAVGYDIETGRVSGNEVILQFNLGYGDYRNQKDWDSWKGAAAAIVLDHPQAVSTREERRQIRQEMRAWTEAAQPQKILFNGNYDGEELRRLLQARLRGYNYDAMFAAYLAHSHLKSFSLHNVGQTYFPEFADFKKITEGHTNYAEVPLPDLALYGCGDADLTLRIYRRYRSARTDALLKVYTKAAVTLHKMEERGPVLDMQALERVDAVIPRQIEELETRIKMAAEGDRHVNPNTPADIVWLLYDKLGLPKINGNSTSKETLAQLADTTSSEVPKMVSSYRHLKKAKGTYIDGYRKSAEESDGELRTSWNTTGAASGRISSGGKSLRYAHTVNFQNFHGNPLLKNLLVADKDWRVLLQPNPDPDTRIFVAFDYSQIEIRMLAMAAQDPLLIRQFNSGEDIHCQVGHTLTGWPVEQIAKDKETRRLVKNLHFGIVYGISKGGLVDYLRGKGVRNVKVSKTHGLYDAYFERYKYVARWIDRQRARVSQTGYAENLFGFRRAIGDWDTSRGTYWANQAINTPIQGAAHTLLLIALALLELMPKRFNLLQEPVMEVHDALVFFCKLRDVAHVYQQGMQLLQTAVPAYIKRNWGITLQVPLLSEAEAGPCYGSMVEYAGGPIKEFLTVWRDKHIKTEKEGWEKLFPELVV